MHFGYVSVKLYFIHHVITSLNDSFAAVAVIVKRKFTNSSGLHICVFHIKRIIVLQLTSVQICTYKYRCIERTIHFPRSRNFCFKLLTDDVM